MGYVTAQTTQNGPQSAAGEPSRRDLFVVGIGASAGGLDALRTLFATVPPNPGVAFVVVVHLSPEHESHLDELLKPHTSLAVQQVNETVLLEPDHVYVIPPNANLSAVDTHLRLAPLERRRIERAPIDHFFRTLARAHDGRSVAVILTGNGSDGSRGFRRIRESGGLTIAQDPEEAQCDGMPRSAIASGMVDVVAPLREIVAKALGFCATRPVLPAPNDAGGANDESLREILAVLQAKTGHDFSVYRHKSLYSRIARRMQICSVERLGEYLAILRDTPGEPHALSDDLLLTVAEFFDDQPFFAALEQEILPQIFRQNAAADGAVRVWSIGCSTGEEAYSLSMLLVEQAERSDKGTKVRVFATDLADDLLQRAREGIYPHEVAQTLSRARLFRFFEEAHGHYRVRRELRDLVVFASHNLFSDPPFVHLDLIVCRTLLHDLQPDIRPAVVRLLHNALDADGVLVLDPRDEIEATGLFVREGKSGVYRRVERPGAPRAEPLERIRRLAATPGERPGVVPKLGDDLAPLHERLVRQFASPSLLVDLNGDVARFSDGMSAFVRLPGGRPTRKAVELVREALRPEVETALATLRANGGGWRSGIVRMRTEDGVRQLVLRAESAGDDWILLSFDTVAAQAPEPAVRKPEPIDIAQLAFDLERAERRLHAVLESQRDDRRAFESSQGGLQIEIDELRMILQELESSRQELQAANEELLALDADNRRKIRELAELSADLNHLLESTGVATIFVDRDLRIVRFTLQFAAQLGLRNQDRGRSLADLSIGAPAIALEADARAVIEHGAAIEREMAGPSQKFYLVRVQPYSFEAGQPEGAVITFIDITERKRVEERLREADRRKDEFLALLAHELRNPLAPITSGIELLKMAGNDSSIVDQVSATLARQTRQLVRLVDDLLEISRISGGRLKLQRSPVALADVVADAVASVQPLIERAGHELSVTLPSEPLVLDADGQRLAQVFGNLLNNAVRYTPTAGKVSLNARREDCEAVVTVRDSGIGMSAETRERVFEMFFQGGDARRSGGTGLGIGLTLAKSLIEMHGGSIAVASEGTGRGTELTLRLPLAERQFVPRDDTAQRDADLGGHRVLIVDDNTDAAETLSVLMRTLGTNEVQTAANGADALHAGGSFAPDIVLLDLKMPGMDGFEVARRIRQEPWGAHTLLVALTGYGHDEHRRRTREAGFDRHLTKPASRAAIASLLERTGQAAAPS